MRFCAREHLIGTTVCMLAVAACARAGRSLPAPQPWVVVRAPVEGPMSVSSVQGGTAFITLGTVEAGHSRCFPLRPVEQQLAVNFGGRDLLIAGSVRTPRFTPGASDGAGGHWMLEMVGLDVRLAPADLGLCAQAGH